MLRVEDAHRSYLKTLAGLQKGRWARRSTYYVFNCRCGAEIEYPRAGLHKRSGRCRSCADRDTGAGTSLRMRKRPYEALFGRFVYDRKRAGQESALTYEQFLGFTEQGTCHYCGADVAWAERALAKNGYGYHLDRKDNGQGYSIENCVVCCWPCNELKGSRFSYDEMRVVVQALMAYRLSLTKGGSCGA